METKVISAFPGTGKSYFYKNSNLTVLDSDSSKFDKSDFPANYIKHINENIGKADIILVSSHDTVRKALVEAGIDFTLVYPSILLKAEYLDRYRSRGSSLSFIKLIEDNWESWIQDCQEQNRCIHLVLASGDYLSDVI